MLPACRKVDVVLTNGFRLRRDGRETTWHLETEDMANLLGEFFATGTPFFDSVASLSGVEDFFVSRERGPLSLRQQESLFYCYLLRKKFQNAYRATERILSGACGEIRHVYGEAPDPTDWRLKLIAEISQLRDLLANRAVAQIGRVLEANEKASYRALSWPPECIGQSG
jgi:hypothetical protein